jgi:molybdenum-dependent DNA-binding transcriptional regulator ModE
VDKLSKDSAMTRQGGRIAGRYREDRRRVDRLMRDAERSQAEAVQRRERIRAATRSSRAAVTAREAADLRLVDALIGLLHAGMSVRTAAERVGVGYHQARQLIGAAEVGGQG